MTEPEIVAELFKLYEVKLKELEQEEKKKEEKSKATEKNVQSKLSSSTTTQPALNTGWVSPIKCRDSPILSII